MQHKGIFLFYFEIAFLWPFTLLIVIIPVVVVLPMQTRKPFLFLASNLQFCYFLIFRYTDYSFANHGQASAGPIRIIQLGGGSRWAGRRYQQETLAGNHQRPPPALVHHICCLHSAHAVSWCLHNCSVQLYGSALAIGFSSLLWPLAAAACYLFCPFSSSPPYFW